MIEETIKKLRARAVDRRLRDINMVGEANVKPIEHFFDWKSADEIEQLRERVAEMQAEAGMYHSLYDVATERLASARKALEEIYTKDTRVTDGGKCHDLGPCAEIATAALFSLTDENST